MSASQTNDSMSFNRNVFNEPLAKTGHLFIVVLIHHHQENTTTPTKALALGALAQKHQKPQHREPTTQRTYREQKLR
jgi:hypothetical protein